MSTAPVASINTIALQGIEVVLVNVQVLLVPGLPCFHIVGLPDKIVNESRERVKAALHSMGFALPLQKITVNLSPAHIYKEGSHYDLVIALGVLVASGILRQKSLDRYLIMGELRFCGEVLRVPGVLPAALKAKSCDMGIICPHDNAQEAAYISKVEVLATPTLIKIVQHLKGEQKLESPVFNHNASAGSLHFPDLKEIKGQELAKRALIISAAGGHNLLMNGPPGSGKSMLARAMIGILPDMTEEETIAVKMIASIARNFSYNANEGRPFREPHHSCSLAAMVGGGRFAMPGEITLAHNGVLFLDELPEFPRQVLDSLRQPLETGVITVSRANAHVDYPARFLFLAAMNPCRCGYLGDPSRECRTNIKCGRDYQSKISGPLLDRIDIKIEVSRVNIITESSGVYNTDGVKKLVNKTRKMQLERYQGTSITCNAHADLKTLEKNSQLQEASQKLLQKALESSWISGRGYLKTLRVARTIADISGSSGVEDMHVLESLNYVAGDRH